MKKIITYIPIISCIFFLFCNQKAERNNSEILKTSIYEDITKKYSLTEENCSFEEFNEAVKNYDSLVIMDGSKFVIKGDSLLVNNNVYISKNTDNDNREIYNYYGYCQPLGMNIININYYEGGEVIMQDNIRKFRLQGIPYISNNQKYLATYFINVYEEESYIDIYQTKEGRINEIIHFTTQDWFPWKLAWKNDVIYLKITKNIWNDEGYYSTDFKYKKLIINN
jgi:hypothetical protein